MEDVIDMVDISVPGCQPEIQELLDACNYVSVNTLAAKLTLTYDQAVQMIAQYALTHQNIFKMHMSFYKDNSENYHSKLASVIPSGALSSYTFCLLN